MMPLPGGWVAASGGLRVAMVFPQDVTAGPQPAMVPRRTATAFLQAATVVRVAMVLRVATVVRVATHTAIEVPCGG